jgi:uncharacterized protein
MTTLAEKETRLKDILRGLKSAAVAFSGGVDSTFLLRVASEVLGDKVAAVTGRSLSFPERELSAARRFTREHGLTHLEIDSEELETAGFAANPVNRCYLCKKALFTKILKAAEAQGLSTVMEASNLDDEGDFRPGFMAIRELGVLSPLLEAGLTKSDIRVLSRERGLPTWDKPSFACLASRFPYGEPITPEGLKKVDAAETFLISLGCRQVRVRCHDQGRLARIEADEAGLDLLATPVNRRLVTENLAGLGFTYIALDLQGYRTGSLNEILAAPERLTDFPAV